jgi:hypothetical protein
MHWITIAPVAGVSDVHHCHAAVVLLEQLLAKQDDGSGGCAVHC